MLEKIELLSKEELIEAVRTLETKLSALEKENEELKTLAEVGKKYEEYLRKEASKLVKVVEGEASALLKLIERADVDTLSEIVNEYKAKATEKLQPSSVQAKVEDEKIDLEKMSYQELVRLAEKFKQEVV
jgi:tRNA U34 5-carboxymethylaminomethyl modifying enzyme MnmG/GidA